MSLKIKCTQCGKSYRVEDTWAGRRVRCTACGTVMIAPAPVAPPPPPPSEQEPDWAIMDDVESSGVPLRQYSPSPPPLVAYSSEPASPYVTVPNEELIDRWLPWAAVAMLVLSIVIEGAIVISKLSGRTNANDPIVLATVIGFIVGSSLRAVVVPAAAGALMLLGVFIGSRILSFNNQRLLYWRCIAAACAFFATTSLLSSIGVDLMAIRIFLALIIGCAVLWLLLRLRLPQFALAGGLALTLGILLPGGVIWGLSAALNSFVASSRLTASKGLTGSGTTITHFTNSLNTQASLRQKSAAHLREINQALVLYAMDHSNAGPATLNDLVNQEHLPADDLNAPGGQGYHFSGYSPQTPGNAIVAYEEAGRAQLGGVTILFKDGSIQFFAGNSADPLLLAPAGQPVVQQPNFQFQPHQMPTVHPSQRHFQMPDPPAPVDPTQLLQKFASACQSYFSAHDSSYPWSPNDLVGHGLLKPEEIHPGFGKFLRMTSNLPRLQPLPADVIVAYVLDTQNATTTVLFGDWHIQSMNRDEFRDAQKKSQQALITARQHQ